MKKIIQRTCMGCNSKKEKKDLIRIVMNKEGKIFIDEKGKLEGRGAYICNNIKCLDNAIKTKRLNRIFEKNIDDKIYEDLRGVIIDNSEKTEKNSLKNCGGDIIG